MVTKEIIVPLLEGRLGNNLFMIANAYARGLDSNRQVVINRQQVIYEGNDYSQNIFRKLEFVDNYPANPVYLQGYFQSETFFDMYSENIKSLFGPPLEFIQRIKNELPFIFYRPTTVINVRRGDYLNFPNNHPTISKEYIEEAIKHAPSEFYLIASDDISWCRENIILPNSHYLEGYTPYEQLWILSLCNHFIISNSSFSWWASWLSRHDDKVVVAPSIWVGPGFLVNVKETYCKDWIVVPSYFEDGYIKPTLNILT